MFMTCSTNHSSAKHQKTILKVQVKVILTMMDIPQREKAQVPELYPEL